MKYYEMVFEVTETCQNGNERTFKKSVFSPIFRIMPDGSRKHLIQLNRVEKAIKELEKHFYYNIKYIKTKATDLLFIYEEERSTT